MHTRYFQAGGLAEDIPPGFYRRVPQVRRLDAARGRRLRVAARPATRSGSSARAGVGLLSADDAIALGQSGPVLRASGVDWDLRKAEPYLAYDEVDFDVPGLPRRRRLRPLPRAHGGDARVDADRRAVPRRARGHGGRAVDRGRPQGRAAAARGAPHLDGVADPPLQDRHRGLPRSRGRGLRRRSSRRAASSAATSSPTAARSRGA